jgi:hypothetical protein
MIIVLRSTYFVCNHPVDLASFDTAEQTSQSEWEEELSVVSQFMPLADSSICAATYKSKIFQTPSSALSLSSTLCFELNLKISILLQLSSTDIHIYPDRIGNLNR